MLLRLGSFYIFNWLSSTSKATPRQQLGRMIIKQMQVHAMQNGIKGNKWEGGVGDGRILYKKKLNRSICYAPKQVRFLNITRRHTRYNFSSFQLYY